MGGICNTHREHRRASNEKPSHENDQNVAYLDLWNGVEPAVQEDAVDANPHPHSLSKESFDRTRKASVRSVNSGADGDVLPPSRTHSDDLGAPRLSVAEMPPPSDSEDADIDLDNHQPAHNSNTYTYQKRAFWGKPSEVMEVSIRTGDIGGGDFPTVGEGNHGLNQLRTPAKRLPEYSLSAERDLSPPPGRSPVPPHRSVSPIDVISIQTQRHPTKSNPALVNYPGGAPSRRSPDHQYYSVSPIPTQTNPTFQSQPNMIISVAPPQKHLPQPIDMEEDDSDDEVQVSRPMSVRMSPMLLQAIKNTPRNALSPRDVNNQRPGPPAEMLDVKSQKKKFAHFESNLHAMTEYSSQGDLGSMTELLEEGTGVNYRIGEAGDTPLTTACQFDQAEAVSFLLDRGAKIEEKNFGGCTPLYIAAECGSLECLKLLISHMASVNAAQDEGAIPLQVAAEAGNFDCVKLLVESKARVNKADEEGMTALHACVQESLVDIVDYLIEQKANVNKQDTTGSSPLHIAAGEGSIDVITSLINGGADVNLIDNDGATVLWHACSQGHEECVKFFIDQNVDASLANSEGATPLYIACEEGLDDCLSLLLKHNSGGLNTILPDSWTPLLIAVYNSNVRCVKKLIKANADVNQQFESGASPTFVACQIGSGEDEDGNVQKGDRCLKMLIKSNADINLQDDDGMTPVAIACENGNVKCLKLLIKFGADINLADNEGTLPFEIAEEAGHEDCLQLLRSPFSNLGITLYE